MSIAKLEPAAMPTVRRPDVASEIEWWNMAKEQARALVSTKLLPNSVDTPEKALAIMMKGRELGVPPMYALSNIVVVQGKPTCSAELMLALVRRDHGTNAIRVKHSDNERCVVQWREWGEVSEYTFSMEDAKRAALLGKPGPWQQYPAAMLRARCISAVCRMAFPESIAGMYVADELGASVQVRESGEVEIVAEHEPPTNIRERVASQARFNEVVNQVLTPELIAGAKQEIADFRANGMDVRLNLDDKDRPRIEVVDESTGEIVQTMTAEREREVVADTEPELKRAMKFMHASARNKLSEEQMHVVSRAAFGVTSHKDLTVAQLDALGSAYQEVPLSHVNALIEISDVLVNDPGGSDAPMSDAILAAVGEEIRKAGFGPKVRELLRVAYLLAEATMKGRN